MKCSRSFAPGLVAAVVGAGWRLGLPAPITSERTRHRCWEAMVAHMIEPLQAPMLGGVRTIVTNKVHFATAERTRGARPGKAQRTGAPCAIIADEVAADPGGAFVHTLRIVMREDAGQLLSTRDGHTPSCSEERCAPRRHRPCFPHRKARYSEQMRTVTVAMLLVACGGNQLASNNPPPAESPRIGEACRGARFLRIASCRPTLTMPGSAPSSARTA